MKTRTAKENIADLPSECFGILPSSRALIKIKAGETGYYPLAGFQKLMLLGETTEEFCDRMNRDDGVTRGQRACMEHGSLFGWETAGANIENYRPDGTFSKVSGIAGKN